MSGKTVTADGFFLYGLLMLLLPLARFGQRSKKGSLGNVFVCALCYKNSDSKDLVNT